MDRVQKWAPYDEDIKNCAHLLTADVISTPRISLTRIFGFDILGSPRLCENQLLGKALSERHQQLEWAIEPNLPPQECPHHAFFLPQKADPRLRVSGNVQIGLADMPLLHADLLFP
jgi:hypothetical protein